ncbi:MAG: hypothetical protein HN919_22445 [Verrucomicrobia bacterium]|nr:hypothetical protein [Verrucomicrobiota bacterium]
MPTISMALSLHYNLFTHRHVTAEAPQSAAPTEYYTACVYPNRLPAVDSVDDLLPIRAPRCD